MQLVKRVVRCVALTLAVLAGWGGPAFGQRLLFVSNDGSSQPSVSVFAVDAPGGLTAVAGSPFATGGMTPGADSIVLTPDGSHLYVTNSSGSVSGFSVGGSGALTPLAGSPWPAGAGALGLAIAPGGAYLFATNSGAGTVSTYSVGSDGGLTPLGTTALGSGQTGPGSPAITPNGGFLYVPDSQGVVAFAIGSDGSLSAAPGSPYALPGPLNTPAAGVTPDGSELLVGMGYGAGTIAAYSIAADGALTSVAGSPFTAASGQSGIGIPALAVSPTGTAVYGTDGSALAGMSIGADRALTALPGDPFAYPQTASQPQAIAVAPGGGEVFADDPGNNVVQAYTAAGDGALMASGSPVPTGDADPDQGGITVSPDHGPTAALAAAAAPAHSASAFDASNSTAVDGTIASYAWNFGDGAAATSSSPMTTHVYVSPGSYVVTLTVTTSDGCSTTGPFTGQSPACTLDPEATTSSTVTVPPATTVPPPAAPFKGSTTVVSPPIEGKTATITPLSGSPLIKKGSTFVPVTSATSVPLGSTIDVTKGSIRIETSGDSLPPTAPRHTIQSATLSEGIFTIKQELKAHKPPATDLILDAKARALGAAGCTRRHPNQKGVIRGLDGVVKGNYRVVAAASTLTIQKGRFRVQDRCDGTLTRIQQGRATIAVTLGQHRHHTVTIHAGQSYLAKLEIFKVKQLAGHTARVLLGA
jgi:6-phosphogluconolactonase